MVCSPHPRQLEGRDEIPDDLAAGWGPAVVDVVVAAVAVDAPMDGQGRGAAVVDGALVAFFLHRFALGEHASVHLVDRRYAGRAAAVGFEVVVARFAAAGDVVAE